MTTKKEAPDVGIVAGLGDGLPASITPAKEASYVCFPIAALFSEFPLEEIPPERARRIYQRCLAWHIANTKCDPELFTEVLDDVSLIATLAAEVPVTFGRQRALFPIALFRDAMDYWAYRKFAILAALYASVGQYAYRVVTRDKISAGSVGFSNQREREAFGSAFEPISVSKLRSTIDHLEATCLIARSKFNGRTTAYGRVTSDVKQRVAERRRERKSRESVCPFEELTDSTPTDDSTTAPSTATPKPSTPSSAETIAARRAAYDEQYRARIQASIEREKLAEQHRLKFFPKKETLAIAAVPPPKAVPTPEETERRRQAILKLTGGNEESPLV